MTTEASPAAVPVRFFQALGPAIIVASVVLGPGSILSSSKVGAAYGYSMVWVLFLAAGLMMGMVALSARLGVTLQGTMCDELAARLGRPLAVLVGLSIFLICAGFQFGNNLGVLAALDPWLRPTEGVAEPRGWFTAPNLILFGLNAAILAFVFGSRKLYKPVERMMMVLVAMMIFAFFGNFLFLLVAGQGTGVEQQATGFRGQGTGVGQQGTGVGQQGIWDRGQGSGVGAIGVEGTVDRGQGTGGEGTGVSGQEDKAEPTVAPAKPAASTGPSQSLLAVLGLMGTTFSVAGAFYQSYLVREKGWGMADVKRGLIDSVAGISVLGTITLVIMLTSAMSFYGKNVELKSAADVAAQLEPLFGKSAVILFSVGIFAGSFSSFLVNAMIGGAMMADGLGLGGKMDALPTKIFTAAALLTGMLVAAFVPADDRVGLVVFAQALVVIGFPLLAASMLYLATRPDLTGPRRIPTYLKLVAVLGLIVVLLSAGRLGWSLIWS